MIISIDQDPGLNVYAIFRDPSDNWATGSATETYNAAHWASQYAVTAPESGGSGTSGHYVVTVPAYLPPSTLNYSVTFYERLGASPAPGDRSLGSQSFSVPVYVIPPAPPPATLIAQMRILSSDTDTANTITGETLTGNADGLNTYFRFQFRNIVPNSVYLSYSTVFRSQSGFTLDYTNGIVTFSVAPVNALVILADYNFYWFADSDYQEFLNDAARLLLVGGNDPTQVVQGLVPALLHYALYYFWLRRATHYAHRYPSSGGQAGQNIDAVTKNFLELAKQAQKAGDKARDDYYMRQGQRNSPSSSVFSYGINPYTPTR